ncbi:MAG TPA: DUF2975 domain-containing protein [Bacteroidetes bacterium]|nr:DUF2975 domain-containing protein [Bacteroidota bacterium]
MNKVATSLAAFAYVSFYELIILTILLLPTLLGPHEFLIVRIGQIVHFIMAGFILWQVRNISKGIRDGEFFPQRTVVTLNRLSAFLLLYVFFDYWFTLYSNLKSSVICSSFSFAEIIILYIKPINFSLLFLSAITFLLSFLASEGNELKEENNLTI